ncbi:hypothetical protein SAMN04488074_1444 [Lentzea albidocapillata subsp. violacea]|uniref:Colicin D immunity protein domain-containing protein n=1 Tax=Lentzea albidocapillata subsp. violacea TaxID=128104 RepID=A0A1H0A850_9PSEU|nr:hypothetical protein [Lentzea albidocapillata]SDN29123.1 hypothetical protein SAMN04488074_1444 [Lentzea albidocapillata subsp. violacea]
MTDRAGLDSVARLSAILFDGGANFSPAWLSRVDGVVVPFASPAHIDRRLADVLYAGAKAVRVDSGVAGRLSEDHQDDAIVPVSLTDAAALAAATWRDTGFVVALPDLTAALVVTTDGYALLGGSPAFVRGAVIGGGVDDARARFGRVAKKLGGALPGIAAQYPPLHREWATMHEVEPGSAVSEQVALMTSVVAGEISPPAFASKWMNASSRRQNHGERVSGALGTALHDVFFVIEDYAEPDLWEPGDLNDEELVIKVREALALLDL